MIYKHFNICCFIAVAYTTLDRLYAIFFKYLIRVRRQEGHPACKYSNRCQLTVKVTTTCIILYFNKHQLTHAMPLISPLMPVPHEVEVCTLPRAILGKL